MIAVGGENLIDLIELAGDTPVQRFEALPGGSCYNCALALGRLGVDVRYITPISSDAFGDRLADHLIASGVAVTGPRVSNPTSMAVVTLSDGQPSYQFYRDGTAERCITDQSVRDGCQNAQAFQIGGLSLIDGEDADIWVSAAEAAKGDGVLVSLDPNVRPTLIGDRDDYLGRLHRLLAVTDILKVSDEDLAWISPELGARDAFARLSSVSAAQVKVLTMGAQGAVLESGGASVHVPASPVVEIIDTVGAGDTFMAALLAAVVPFLSGTAPTLGPDTLQQIGQFAAQASAINCGRKGCDPPTRGEITSAKTVRF